jgi:hypothetical protein
MLGRTRWRLRSRGREAQCRLVQCGLADLESHIAGRALPPFDAVVSNFGALNCVDDLTPLGRLSSRHLAPGGAITIGLLGRYCLAEQIYFLLSGRASEARRRLRPSPVLVQVAGVEVPTYYHRVSDLVRALGDEVCLQATVGLGVAVPPPYLEPRWQALPRPCRDAAKRLDDAIASWLPFNRWGDHTQVLLRKRGPAHG